MRQDALIAMAFLTPFDMNESFDRVMTIEDSSITMASLLSDEIYSAILQRVKQLGAHEVGHSLGLAHNFAGTRSVTVIASPYPCSHLIAVYDKVQPLRVVTPLLWIIQHQLSLWMTRERSWF
jgi:hypothetical protein